MDINLEDYSDDDSLVDWVRAEPNSRLPSSDYDQNSLVFEIRSSDKIPTSSWFIE